MNSKLLQGIATAAISIIAVVFLIMGYLGVAALFMTVLFFLTNNYRYHQMKAQGMDKEAKWMRGMTIIFAVLFFVVLFTLIF